MRKLKTTDVFEALRLIKKANLKEELRPVIASVAEGSMSIENIGISGILSVVEIFTEKKAEKAIYEFLSGPFEMTVAQIEDLPLAELAKNFVALAEENDLKNFFGILQAMSTKKS